MGSPKESLEQKNVFTEKYDEIRRLDGTPLKTFTNHHEVNNEKENN
jgi:hypothetical protein